MEGWRIRSATYIDEFMTEVDIWKIFNHIFSNKSVNATSYKFGFLKALIESVFETNDEGEIKISTIFERFSIIYWSLIIKHNLRQCTNMIKGGKSSVAKIFDRYINDNEEYKVAQFDNIDAVVRKEIQKEVFTEGKKYVVGAIYGDSRGSFYSFSLKDDYLKFNPKVLNFIQKYNVILLKLNYMEWIKFLEKVNLEENCYSIATKLDESSKRTNLKVYKDYLYYDIFNEETKCFYCNSSTKYNKIHIDHFIPWSFIKNDRLWNLVISCPKCNLSKNDKLADSYYLDKLIYRDNFIAKLRDNLVIQDFKLYNEEKLKAYYNSAEFCGFYAWEYIKAKDIEINTIYK